LKQTAAIFIISFIFAALILSVTVSQNTFAKSAKDSKARRDINKAIGQAVEGKFSSIKTVNISTYTAPNESFTVWNKTSPGSLPPIITPPEPQVCNKNDHFDPVTGFCVPDSPTSGFKVCMAGDFKDSKVFDAMKTNGCNYRIALGDNGYGSDLKLLKSISPDKCVVGNHDSIEDGSATIEKEALAYCGNSWWVKFNGSTLMLGFNTNGDLTKQLNAAKDLLFDKAFMSGVKNVIALSHKGGHVFPSAHHPAEAKTFYAELEGNVPVGVKLIEVSGHNHNAAAAPTKGWYISGNGGKNFYSCGIDKDWTFCNNKTISYLEATIPKDSNNNTVAVHFIDTVGKIIG
jgi:hypothetical protein